MSQSGIVKLTVEVPVASFTQRVAPESSTRSTGWSARLVISLILLLFTTEISYLVFAYPSSALSQIAADLKTDQVAWLQTILALVAAVSAVLIGKLADRFGKKRLLIIVVALVALGLTISGLAPNFWVVLIGRALQGTTLTMPFLVAALIRDVYPQRTIPLAVSLSAAGTGIISIVASLQVGSVIATFGWRGTFLVPATIAVIMLVLVIVFVPESTVRARFTNLDVMGAALLGLGIMGILLGVSLGGTWGWVSLTTIGTFAAGIAFLALWYFRSTRIQEPIIDLVLLRQPALRLSLAYATVAIGIVSFFFLLIPTVVLHPATEWGLGLDASALSLVATLFSFGTFVAGFVVGKAMERIRVPFVGIGLLIVEAVGFFTAAAGLSNAVLFCIGAFLIGTAGGAGIAVSYTMIMHVVRPEQQATTSSLASVVGNLWAAIMPVVIFALMRAVSPAPVDGVIDYSYAGMLIATIVPGALLLLGIPFAFRLRRYITRTRIEAEPEGTVTV